MRDAAGDMEVRILFGEPALNLSESGFTGGDDQIPLFEVFNLYGITRNRCQRIRCRDQCSPGLRVYGNGAESFRVMGFCNNAEIAQAAAYPVDNLIGTSVPDGALDLGK